LPKSVVQFMSDAIMCSTAGKGSSA
jgi:hypothetical protein